MKSFNILIMVLMLIAAMLSLFQYSYGPDASVSTRSESLGAMRHSTILTELATVNLDWRTVAEPSTMLFFGAGLIGLAAWGRWKQ